ncbi:formate--tetrahydrofolate ligase [Actinomycetaceae bacterium TAE3-ERU4]|nr:formate--tetrahydrofolate ligase [Actinomycetaceae bacterium TAE3-ERU4]
MTDLQIAREANTRPITEIAAKLGIEDSNLELYGPYKAKISAGENLSEKTGRLVLVTAVSPTPAGEGKTTTSVGLCDALNLEGVKASLSLREPSMGPVFGIKGGAAGGGYAQVIPMEDINLAFTGDFAAIAQSHNLLSAMIDNHLHQGNSLNLDARQIWWRRVMDMNDRALRQITVGLGGATNGFLREDGFDIVSASEIMAIICLSRNLMDLRSRLGKIVIGLNLDGVPVTAEDIGAAGAMAVILRDAIKPNLVQTLEGNPAFIHGGPFANIAHGCSSLAATSLAMELSDVVVTEAGFGADLGAEKFFDILCQASGLRPALSVLVATVRSVKYNSGVAVSDLNTPNIDAVRSGCANLLRHIENLENVFGVRTVVALNRFPSDTPEELECLRNILNVPCVSATHFSQGGEGARELAKVVKENLLKHPSSEKEVTFAYDLADTYEEKAYKVATSIYRAGTVTWSPGARRRLAKIEEAGYVGLPICIAKTQYSFSSNPRALGAPVGHELQIREVRLSAGAGFVVLVAGEMMTMPGLSKNPAALGMDIDENGQIIGLS